mmetsp:Transcript_33531/g.94132  ORF Transcript_33531/g.94132 Transcript_33531/m.94132 type:complete len:526 (-) Transcript_33531:227-1804(-)
MAVGAALGVPALEAAEAKMTTGDREVVEAFIEHLASNFGDEYVLVSLRPWSGGAAPPPRVLVPDGEGGLLDAAAVEAALVDPSVVLIPCIFAGPEEPQAAARIVPQLGSSKHTCIFMVLLLPFGMEPCRDANDLILTRHDEMLASGVDDVIVNPDMGTVREQVRTCQATWKVNMERIDTVLELEPDVSADEVAALERNHNRLLWEKIPDALMPRFRSIDSTVQETASNMQNYRFANCFETVQGSVLQAVDEHDNPCVIKVIDKKKVQTPVDIECMYREYRFLSDILNHPNIVRCLNMVHTVTRVYFVFDFVGQNNLVQLLSSLPGQRFDEDVTLDCSAQIFQAVAYCHSVNIAHRSLSLEHIVASHVCQLGERYHVTLVDFNCAMAVQRATDSRKVCGRLPCIAPEVARGEPYMPMLVDCWSTGVIILEMGGGLSSLQLSVSYDYDASVGEAVSAIYHFFSRPGSHEYALQYMGGVQTPCVVSFLQRLLQPSPTARAGMGDMLQLLPDAEGPGGEGPPEPADRAR